MKVAVRLGDNSYSGVQIAVLFIFRQSGTKRPAEVKEGVSMYCKGSKRKGHTLKQDLGLAIIEGGKPISKQEYSFLAKTLFTNKDPKHILVYLFFGAGLASYLLLVS